MRGGFRVFHQCRGGEEDKQHKELALELCMYPVENKSEFECSLFLIRSKVVTQRLKKKRKKRQIREN